MSTTSVMTRMPRRCACFRKVLKVAESAIGGVNIGVAGDIVAVVAPGGRKEGQQPDGVDAEILQVIQLAGEAAEIAHAVVFAVIEGAHVDFINDRVLIPESVGFESGRWGRC